MEELKENRNVFTINGYLGRKWYFILGISVAVINMILMAIFCKEIFVQIVEFAKTHESYSVITILTSGAIPYDQLVAYVIVYVLSSILSFINNKKRITDIMGAEKHSYLISAIFTAVTVAAIFVPSISILYSLIIFALTICSFFILLYPGKISNKKEEQTPCEEDGEVETETVVSLWKRLFAYIIDATFILGGVSSLAALSLPDAIFKIGDYSVFIGLILTFAYFGIMNSEICKGQTLGKSITGLKVVNKDGNYLTIQQSLVRTLILIICLTIPYMFFAESTIIARPKSEFYFLLAALTAGILFDLLFLFNFKTRQTLHDLAVGSYVINKNCSCNLKDSKTNKAPIVTAVIITILLSLIIIPGMLLMNSFVKHEMCSEISHELNVKATKCIQHFGDNSNNQTVAILSTNINDEQLAQKVDNYINEKHPPVEKGEYNHNTIILHRTINLGNIVTTKLKSYTYTKYSPNR